MADGVDQVARDKANEAVHDLRNHIAVTEIRLTNIDKKIDQHHIDLTKAHEELKGFLRWAGGLIVSLFLAVMAWSLTQQYNANETAKTDMAQQIQLLKDQERARNAVRAEILSRLGTGTPEPTETPAGTR